MSYNYIKDIIRSGAGETATLSKRPYTNNEFGDPEYIEEEEENYKFKTVVDNLNDVENEQDAGDYIEGDMRFYVSEDCDIEFENGDFIVYNDKEYNITSVRTRTVGTTGFHKEVIAENV